MGSNTEKKPWINLKTYTKNEAKGLRATTKGEAIEKSPIFLSQYWINEEFELVQ